MNTDIHALLLIFQSMPYYFWMITWMKNVNNFRIAKVQPQPLAFASFFCQFQPGAANKSVAYKKSEKVARTHI